MKRYLKLISSLFIFSLLMGNVEAQTRTKTKIKAAPAPKFVETNFGNPSSITDVTDIADSNRAYNSVKNLIGEHVTLTYDDNTFRGNEPLRKGDFIVALNSSLNTLKNFAVENGIDSMMNANNAAAMSTPESSVTNLSDFTDLEEGSVYYPAVQSLMEKGVTAPFTDSKKLDPGAVMSEKDVYDVLNKVFNYDKTGMNPYATSMTRDKFAMVLNNAVTTKMQEQYAMVDQKNAAAEQARQEEKAKMAAEMQEQEQMRKDSLNSAYQAEQQEIEKKALEAQSKKKHKN